MPAHFRIHFVDTFRQADRFVQYLSCVGDAAHMQRIHAAQFNRIDVQCLGEHVHHRLDRKGRLRHAKAAERARGRIVGVHGITIGAHVRDVIRACRVRGGAGHHLFAKRGIRARIAVQFGLHRDETAIFLRAHLDADLRGMALRMHEQTLVTVEQQLHRALRDIRQHRHMDLSHHVFLAAEAAAHQLPDDAHALLRPAHHTRHLRPVLIRDLRADINFHAAIGQRHADAAFRFEEGMVGGRRVEGMFKDHIRFGKTLAPYRPCGP